MRMDQLNNIDNKEVDLLSNEGSVFPNTQVRSIMPKNKNGNKQKRLAKKITRDSSPANPTVESADDKKEADRKMQVTNADKEGNTPAWQRYKAGDPRYEYKAPVKEDFSPKEIKMAIGIASDPRYKGGNMTGAVNAIEKLSKGLSGHKQVMAVLKRQNEDIEEAGGYYTQPVYDMIEKHGYEKVMHELLTSLDADVIQSFLQRNEINEAGDTKYGIVRYPDTAISYIKNDGNGWEHIYDRSYGFKGPVDKNDIQYASKIEKEKIPSRMFKEGRLSHSDIPSRYAVEADEEKDVEFYRTLDAKQLNAVKSKLNTTIESLDHAIEFRARNSRLYFNTGDKAGTGDLYRMKEQLEKLLNSWDESTQIYGM